MRDSCAELDSLIGETTHVLGKGFVILVDYMGTETSIAEAARVSYAKGAKTPKQDQRLIRRLWLDGHTSPFEHCVLRFRLKLPLFVARQIYRHRTASINEISARYTEMPAEFWVPDELRAQSKVNHQCSEGLTDYQDTECWREVHEAAYWCYTDLLERGVSREIARTLLPQSMYTQCYFTMNLRNLMHFLELRLATDTQPETREYAEAMAEVVKIWAPATWAAQAEKMEAKRQLQESVK